MSKMLSVTAVTLFFILGLFSLGLAQESLTITTYYPSPYGSYRQLTADQIAIGSGYRNPTYADGSLYVQGNVGIGTMGPAAKLHVQDYNNPGQPPVVLDRNYDGSRIQLKYAGSNTSSELGMTYYQPGKVDLWIGSNLNSTGASHTGIQQANTGGPSWYERFGSIGDVYNLGRIPAGGAASTFVTINGSGNVGIGTTTIGSKLQVNGNAAIGYSASTAGPSNGLAVSGNVGIGTNNPGTNKLEVVGGPIKATGGLIIETRTSDPASPAVGRMWMIL